jgi:hypothetical protein
VETETLKSKAISPVASVRVWKQNEQDESNTKLVGFTESGGAGALYTVRPTGIGGAYAVVDTNVTAPV